MTDCAPRFTRQLLLQMNFWHAGSISGAPAGPMTCMSRFPVVFLLAALSTLATGEGVRAQAGLTDQLNLPLGQFNPDGMRLQIDSVDESAKFPHVRGLFTVNPSTVDAQGETQGQALRAVVQDSSPIMPTHADVASAIDQFNERFDAIQESLPQMEIAGGDLGEAFRELLDNTIEWKILIETGEVTLDDMTLRQMQAELDFLSGALADIGDNRLTEHELGWIELVIKDIRERTRFLRDGSRNGTKLNLGMDAEVTVLDLTTDQTDSSPHYPEKDGLLVHYAAPYAMEHQFKLEMSSPAEGNVGYATYCYWALDIDGKLVTSVEREFPPRHRSEKGLLLAVSLSFVGFDQAQRIQATNASRNCRFPG